MFFSLDELVQWLGVTALELWLNLVAITVTTLLVALRLDSNFLAHNENGWWIIFSPLFVADAMNAYFCTIVFIRMYLDCIYKAALMRASWSLSALVLIFVFEFLLCKKLAGQNSLEYSEVLAPVFILLQLVAIRACQLH